MQVGLTLARRILRRRLRLAEVLRLAELGEPVSDPGGEPGDLLDRGSDCSRDRAHRGVGAVGHRDGAVGDGVELVELVVDAIDGAAGLHDHGQKVALGSPDERRKPLERLPQAEEHERRGEPDGDEEDREPPVGGVAGSECELCHRGDPTRLRR